MPARLAVQAIAWTHFQAPEQINWTTDATGGEALVEFAGRSCYESWSKPNPATASNAAYVRHLLEVGHAAALEHASVTLYLTGVSRALTHELVRHRHLSFSQLSPRSVPGADDTQVVEPDAIGADPLLHARFLAATDAALAAYRELLAGLDDDSTAPTLAAKQARQAARAVLPAATATRIVVTGNYRAWRHFVAVRASEHADVEIRAVAIACLGELQRVAANAFADFEITGLPDGTQIASSPLANES